MAWCGKLIQGINRKKTLDEDIMETPLRRCLTTVDLTLWGIGHMVGAGIFVLTGKTIHFILISSYRLGIKYWKIIFLCKFFLRLLVFQIFFKCFARPKCDS